MTDDDEYFNNWVEQYDMLCEPKYKVGFLGSIIFLGVIIGLLFVPPLADYFGRKVIFIISLVLSLVG